MIRTYQAVVLVKHSTPISCFIQCLEVELADIFLTRGISMLVFESSARSVYNTPSIEARVGKEKKPSGWDRQ